MSTGEKRGRGKTETEIRDALASVGNTAITIELIAPDGKVYFKDSKGEIHGVAGRTFVYMCEGWELFDRNKAVFAVHE